MQFSLDRLIYHEIRGRHEDQGTVSTKKSNRESEKSGAREIKQEQTIRDKKNTGARERERESSSRNLFSKVRAKENLRKPSAREDDLLRSRFDSSHYFIKIYLVHIYIEEHISR